MQGILSNEDHRRKSVNVFGSVSVRVLRNEAKGMILGCLTQYYVGAIFFTLTFLPQNNCSFLFNSHSSEIWRGEKLPTEWEPALTTFDIAYLSRVKKKKRLTRQTTIKRLIWEQKVWKPFENRLVRRFRAKWIRSSRNFLSFKPLTDVW